MIFFVLAIKVQLANMIRSLQKFTRSFILPQRRSLLIVAKIGSSLDISVTYTAPAYVYI